MRSIGVDVGAFVVERPTSIFAKGDRARLRVSMHPNVNLDPQAAGRLGDVRQLAIWAASGFALGLSVGAWVEYLAPGVRIF